MNVVACKSNLEAVLSTEKIKSDTRIEIAGGKKTLLASIVNNTMFSDYTGGLIFMYEIFSDESGHKRYRTIGALSGHRNNLQALRETLKEIYLSKKIKTIEWKNLNGDKEKENVAIQIYKTLINYVSKLKIRIDVISWDTQDSRHAFPGIDDNKNFEFMYYKLLRWVKQNWIHSSEEWCFYPDQKTGVDWKNIIDIIQNTNLYKGVTRHSDLFTVFPEKRFLKIVDHKEMISHNELLSQSIDLIAGLHRFSLEKGDIIYNALFGDKQQLDLFQKLEESTKDSRSDKSRINIFKEFYANCSGESLHISFKTKRYLWSRKKEKHLNFWLYEPKGDFDKAPKKNNLTSD